MRSIKSKLAIAAVAVAATGAVVTWALASDTVVLHPATLLAKFTYTSEQVSQIQLIATPTNGGLQSYRTVVPSGSSFEVDLTVEGGDGALGTDNPGVNYTTEMYVYVLGQPSTYLRVRKSGSDLVQNISATERTIEEVDMPLTTTHRVTGNVQVLGGKVTRLNLYTTVTDPSGHYYRGYGYGNFPAEPTSASLWALAPPNANVQVWGTAYVEDDAGNASQRSLGTQTVNASAGPVTAPTWTIDLGNATAVHGIVGGATPSAPSGRMCYYYGEGAANGVSGSKAMAPGDLECVVVVSPPATYNLYLRSSLGAPTYQSVSTPRHRFAVSGGRHDEVFNETYGTAVLLPDASGMIDPSELSWSSHMYMPADSYASSSTSIADGYLTQVLPTGAWRGNYLIGSLQNNADPDLPLNETFTIYNYNDPTFPQGTIAAGQTTDLGTFPLILSRANVFFDVKEPSNEAEARLRNPQVIIEKYDVSGGTTLRRTYINAQGSSSLEAVSAMTVVAPPGLYTLLARAEVNGSVATFANSIIRFGELMRTDPVTIQPIVLTPNDPELRLELEIPMDRIEQGGFTTVVETPLGPEPPEKFKLSCDGNAFSCTPLYYDITTTAELDGGTPEDPQIRVCVQRTFHEADNALASELALFHFDPTLTTECAPGMDPDLSTPGCWVDITERHDVAPFDKKIVDCTDDSGPEPVCHCNGDPMCGADPENRKHVFRLCGLTNGFSPFAVMETSRFRYTNEVGGVEYTGAEGPATLQKFKVPRTGTYRITATGAKGGSATNTATAVGGCGAEISGTFALQAGQELDLLVGQAGTSTTQSGGGGGGTFVVRAGEKLVIAGGGGGVRAGATVSGRHGSVGGNGVPGSSTSNYGSGNVAGGLNGGGGARSAGLGSGGGGWSGNGTNDGLGTTTNGEGGFSFLSALNGRGGKGLRCSPLADGGYGGGGAGNGCYGGGGGGGYSGGGGGRVAGGGGSFNAGSNPAGTSGVCTVSGHGLVIIERID